MKPLKITLLLMIVAIAFTACTSDENKAKTEVAQDPAATTPAVPLTDSKQLPAFALVDASGKDIDLKSFAGKKVFVNLWATWCPPCRSEMPSIEKLYQSVDKEKTAFIMLSLDNDFATAKEWIKEKKMNLPIYYPNSNLPELFNVRGIPTTFIFNEQGELIEQKEGADNYDTEAYRQLLGS